MTYDPNSPHWWMRPMTKEELPSIIKLVRDTHRSGKGVASISWNRIEAALLELQRRMDLDD